jgi:hypothetical protein
MSERLRLTHATKPLSPEHAQQLKNAQAARKHLAEARAAEARAERPVIDKPEATDPWWSWVMPAPGQGFLHRLVVLCLMPITGWLLVMYVFIRELFE